MIPILAPEHRFECPNCDQTDVRRGVQRGSLMHNCRGLRGLTAPMVPAGTRCKVVAREREDYVGRELVQTDGEGRPISAVQTVRDDGEDCTVLAPTAQGRIGDIL